MLCGIVQNVFKLQTILCIDGNRNSIGLDAFRPTILSIDILGSIEGVDP